MGQLGGNGVEGVMELHWFLRAAAEGVRVPELVSFVGDQIPDRDRRDEQNNTI